MPITITKNEFMRRMSEMSKMGGGTSGYFGDLRYRGANISVGGESSGPVHFLEIFDKIINNNF